MLYWRGRQGGSGALDSYWSGGAVCTAAQSQAASSDAAGGSQRVATQRADGEAGVSVYSLTAIRSLNSELCRH